MRDEEVVEGLGEWGGGCWGWVGEGGGREGSKTSRKEPLVVYEKGSNLAFLEGKREGARDGGEYGVVRFF